MESIFYNGSVVDAITKVKQLKTCLLVFIYGDDDVSKKYDGYFLSGGKLAQTINGFVCMRIAAQSDTAMQFSAFYPVVSLPTIYLVNAEGVSLEALIGDRTEEDLASRLSAAAAGTGPATSAGATDDNAGATAATAVADTPADWDARVERMEQKMDERQAQKQREAKEREKQAELERRSVGRNLGQLRQQQLAEQERIRAEEVRLERQARLRAKQQQPSSSSSNSPTAAALANEGDAANAVTVDQQTLRDLRASQSAAYHEERRSAEAAREAAEAAKEAELRAAAEAADAERRKRARVQLRCPDGRVFIRELPATDTLRDLRRSIDEELSSKGEGDSRYRLATVYPRRVFLDSEDNLSLGELELAPSASLLLLPPTEGSGGRGRDVASTGSLASLAAAPFMRLYGLLVLLLGFLTAFFTRGGAGTRAASASTSPSSSASPSSPSSSSGGGAAAAAAARRRAGGGGGGATIQRSGNTARLRNIDDGRGPDGADDEGATWNGNSTQQM